MLRRIAAAWAVLGVLAMGFTAPSSTGSGIDETASVGAPGLGISASPLSARRPRAKLASADGSLERSSHLGPGWPFWLVSPVPSPAPDAPEQRVALTSPAVPGCRAAATPRTSRGPPTFATL